MGVWEAFGDVATSPIFTRYKLKRHVDGVGDGIRTRINEFCRPVHSPFCHPDTDLFKRFETGIEYSASSYGDLYDGHGRL